MLNQSNDSTETMYVKLGRKRVSPGCKNCLITGDGTSFFGFPKVLKWKEILITALHTVPSNSYITFAIKYTIVCLSYLYGVNLYVL